MKKVKKIVVLDDEPAIVDLLTQGVRSLGYAADGVQTKAALLESIHRERPAAILLDVGMPGEDGISICRGLRQDPTLHGVPVIIITGFDDEITRGDALLMGGAAGFIAKPFSLDDVRRALESCGVHP